MNLYVHVPFCVKKCNYCAFHSVACSGPDWEAYTCAILQQLDWFRAADYEFETVFFGGGTPSLLPPRHAARILDKIRLAPGAEFTVEANPKTIGPVELKDWKNLGLTRLSVGMQSFNDDELRFLGRIHTSRDALDLLDAGNDLGLRLSADFIYGLPDQAAGDVAKMCERINALDIGHASLYELSREPGTPFANLPPPSDHAGAEMYQAIQRTLRLPRHEVSNYGNPCRHNMAVWRGEEYIGVGESAAGRIAARHPGTSGDSVPQWHETKIMNGRLVVTRLSPRARAIEIIMTSLRTRDGVPIPRKDAGQSRGAAKSGGATDCIDWDFVRANPQWFVPGGESLRMTDAGLLLLDGLLADLII